MEYDGLAGGRRGYNAMSRLSVQVLSIVLFTFTLFIVWDFSQRIITSLRLSQVEQQLEQQVAQAQATQTALVEKKRLVQSPQYVETYVRSRWHWARAGETVVIPQITLAAPPLVKTPALSPPPPNPWW